MAKLKAGEAYIKVSADTRDLSRQINNLKPKIKGLNIFEALQGRGQNPFASISRDIRRINVEMRAFALAGAATTAAVTLPLANATKSLIEFDKQLRRAGAVGNATEAQFTAMSDRAKELGRSTIFTSAQVAEGMKEMLQLGVDVEDTIFNIGNVLDFAAAGNIEMAEAAKILIGVMNGMQIPSYELVDAVDLLATASTRSGANMQELGVAFSKFAPIASLLGINIKEAAAAVGILRDNSIDAEIAGTSLRNIMQRIAGLAASGKLELIKEVGGQQTNAFRQGGKELLTAEGNLKSFVEIIEIFEKKTKGLSAPAIADALKNIAGDREANAFAVLLQAGADELKKFDNVAKGFGKNLSDKLLSGISGAIVKLESSLDTLKLTFSSVFEKELTDAIDVIRSLLNASEDWIMSNKAAVFSVLKIIGGIATVTAGAIALTGALTTLSVIVTGISSAFAVASATFGIFVSGLSFALSPIGALTVGLAVLGKELLSLLLDISNFKFEFTQAFSSIQDIAKTAFESIATRLKAGDIEGAVEVLQTSIIQSFDVLKMKLKVVWERIVGFAEIKILELKAFWKKTILEIQFFAEQGFNFIDNLKDVKALTDATVANELTSFVKKAQAVGELGVFDTEGLGTKFAEIDKEQEENQKRIDNTAAARKEKTARNHAKAEQALYQEIADTQSDLFDKIYNKEQELLERIAKIEKENAEKLAKINEENQKRLAEDKAKLSEKEKKDAEERAKKDAAALEKQKQKEAEIERLRKERKDKLTDDLPATLEDKRIKLSGGFNLRDVQKQFALAQENRTIEEATKMTAEQTRRAVKELEKINVNIQSSNLVFGN